MNRLLIAIIIALVVAIIIIAIISAIPGGSEYIQATQSGAIGIVGGC